MWKWGRGLRGKREARGGPGKQEPRRETRKSGGKIKDREVGPKGLDQIRVRERDPG